MLFTCAYCGCEFKSYNKNRKNCSDRCKGLARVATTDYSAMGKLGGHPKADAKIRNCICRVCGKHFTWRYRKRICPDCPQMGTRAYRICAVCGETFHSLPGYKNCSQECKNIWMARIQCGAKSHRWRGGKTSPVRLARNRTEYHEWRKAVYARDDYTCQLCFERSGKLAAHHIKGFQEYPDLRLEVGNGITLCWPCHTSIRWKERCYENTFYDITGF